MLQMIGGLIVLKIKREYRSKKFINIITSYLIKQYIGIEGDAIPGDDFG